MDALYLHDPDTADEERWVVVGYSERYRMLTVVTWESTDGETIRIISARRATTSEEATYYERNR